MNADPQPCFAALYTTPSVGFDRQYSSHCSDTSTGPPAGVYNLAFHLFTVKNIASISNALFQILRELWGNSNLDSNTVFPLKRLIF